MSKRENPGACGDTPPGKNQRASLPIHHFSQFSQSTRRYLKIILVRVGLKINWYEGGYIKRFHSLGQYCIEYIALQPNNLDI
jgi:hypothetical protein